MNPISFHAPRRVDDALSWIEAGGEPHAAPVKFIGGGTNLLDLMKERIATPRALVDINAVGLDTIEAAPGGGLLLGATARNADTARHPLVRKHYPLLAAAILAGASPQIRNLATNGGNLMQRTRCHYFHDVAVACNKRAPGSGCPAIGGLTRQHAILGASEHCIATHPSDMCVALAALEAVVHVRSARGERQIAFADFHRLPGDQPQRDNTLAGDELIMQIALPEAARFRAHSAYLKLRERASYAFGLVSVAAMLDLAPDGSIRAARVVLGSVAHKPWRSLEAEALLAGRQPDADSFALCAQRLLEGAVGQGQNEFKITMARRAIVRVLQSAAMGSIDKLAGAAA